MEPQLATPQRRALRKRKPEAPPENNERLSKRMSLLNLGRFPSISSPSAPIPSRKCSAAHIEAHGSSQLLPLLAEQSGTKLYIPVESQQPLSIPSALASQPSPPVVPNGHVPNGVHRPRHTGATPGDDEMMQLDDSKYKVYIRNLDDELSSEDESEEGKLIFLPDIEKHLRNNRIPAAILSKPDQDVLSKQLVLYQVPSSISVPEEHDSVRKAIIEARARLREKQRAESREHRLATIPEADMVDQTMPSNVALPGAFARAVPPPAMPEDDPDAMELD